MDSLENRADGLIVDSSIEDPSKANYLIFAPHAVPAGDMSDICARIVAQAFPDGPTKRFLEEDPTADALLKFGLYRADAGAREIAEAFIRMVDEAGATWTLVRPNPAYALGRGILDFNRPNERAVGDGGLTLPDQVADEFRALHATTRAKIDALFRNMNELRGVFQPHTMASGDPDKNAHDALLEYVKTIPVSPGGLFTDPEAVGTLFSQWEALYNAMNQGRNRDSICLVNRLHGQPTAPLWTNELALQSLRESLTQGGFPVAENKPFGHASGYPGSDLARGATQRYVPDITVDVPRFLLAEDSAASIPLLGFRPDSAKVEVIAGAAFTAFASVPARNG